MNGVFDASGCGLFFFVGGDATAAAAARALVWVCAESVGGAFIPDGCSEAAMGWGSDGLAAAGFEGFVGFEVFVGKAETAPMRAAALAAEA